MSRIHYTLYTISKKSEKLIVFCSFVFISGMKWNRYNILTPYDLDWPTTHIRQFLNASNEHTILKLKDSQSCTIEQERKETWHANEIDWNFGTVTFSRFYRNHSLHFRFPVALCLFARFSFSLSFSFSQLSFGSCLSYHLIHFCSDGRSIVYSVSSLERRTRKYTLSYNFHFATTSDARETKRERDTKIGVDRKYCIRNCDE